MIGLGNLRSLLHPARALLLCFVPLSFGAGGLAVATATAFGAEEVTETINLDPGDNYVGWVSDPISVDEVFAEIPEAALIYTWDADRRSWRFAIRDVGGSLAALEPGMAAMIRIGGEKPVEWQRPLTPAKGGVTLYNGVNWVTWLGRDDWPLHQVARGIGKSLVSVRIGDQTWDAPIDAGVEELPTLRRGDALEVTVSRDLKWLQPTGIMPNIVWVGDIPQSLRDKITVDIQHALQVFADRFGVETDFSQTTILLYQNVEDAIEHEATGNEPQVGEGVDWLRSWLTLRSNSTAYPWGFHMITCAWEIPEPQPCRPRAIDTLIHEWLHVLQYQYGMVQEGRRLSPAWTVEGQAMWVQWLLPPELQNVPYEIDHARRVGAVARTSVSLQSLEDHSHHWAYFHGPLASERLAAIAGAEAHIEYMRWFQPQIVGQERHWAQTPTWTEAFEAAFGISPAAFYEDFETWRGAQPAPEQRYDYNEGDVTLAGTLHYDDGTPAAGFQVRAAHFIDGFSVALERTTTVLDDGSFSIDVAPDSMQRVSVLHRGCSFALGQDGLEAGFVPAAERLEIDTRHLRPLQWTVPEGACRDNELRVRALRLKGDERHLRVLLSDVETGDYYGAGFHHFSDLYYGYAPKPGPYHVRIRLNSCELHYSTMGLLPTWQGRDVVELSDEPASIAFRVPYSLCVRRISGRVVDEDGGVTGADWLHIQGGGMYSSGPVGADGVFDMAVPDSGSYVLRLNTEVPGCMVYYSTSGATAASRQATRITVADEDVAGIEFVVPADPSSRCD